MGEITRGLVERPQGFVNQITRHPAGPRGDHRWTA